MAGVVWTRQESRWFLGVIPVMSLTNHWVRGPCCNAEVLCKATPKEIAEYGADEIESRCLLRKELSLLALVLTAFSLVLCFLPGLGMVLSAAGYWINRRETWWVKSINVAGFVLNLLWSCWVTISALFLEK